MANQLKRAGNFIEESWDELQRVTWPDWPQLKNATLVVIVFCVLVALVIWIMGVFGA
jgi:preprotein translocase SecE subunit